MRTKRVDGLGGPNYLSAVQVRGGPHIPFSESVATLRTPAGAPRKVAAELLQRIAKALAEEAPLVLAEQQTKDVLLIASAELQQAKNLTQATAGLAKLREAEENYRLVRETLEHARARVIDLYREGDDRARAALLEASTT